MSYILDALKKSDRERKRGDVPNLQTVHIPITVETQTPKLLYGLVSLLLLALALMVGMMLAGNQTNNANVNVPLPLEDKNTLQHVDAPLVMEEKIQQKNASIKHQEMKRVIEKKILPVETIKSSAVKNESLNIKSVSEKKPAKVSRKLELSNVPYLHEMPEYVQQSIPQMKFAGHVYSTNAKNRTVIINGYAMSEGDTLVEGIDVIEITPSGVVFSLQGEYFRVDILQDWSFE